MLRARSWASGYLPSVRCCELGLSAGCGIRNGRKWLEIAKNFDFRLTSRRDLDNLEKFAQKRHSLLSGPRKSKLNSCRMLSLAEIVRNNRGSAYGHRIASWVLRNLQTKTQRH